MKSICVGSLKGGTGKTSYVFHISSWFANAGYNVLLLDLDAQANTTSNLGIDEFASGFKSVVDLFEKQLPPEEIIIKSPIEQIPTLDIIPSSVLLTGTELRLVNVAARELILKNYFKKNKEYFSKYHYVIIDTNPSMSIVNTNAFAFANSIMLITDVSMNGLKGIELFTALWRDIADRLVVKDNIKGIVVNRYDKRIKLSSEFLEYCRQNTDIKPILFNTVIPENVKLREAELSHIPIALYDKKNKGYEAYKSLYTEMWIRGVI